MQIYCEFPEFAQFVASHLHYKVLMDEYVPDVKTRFVYASNVG